jgi:hypothetical protein
MLAASFQKSHSRSYSLRFERAREHFRNQRCAILVTAKPNIDYLVEISFSAPSAYSSNPMIGAERSPKNVPDYTTLHARGQ